MTDRMLPRRRAAAVVVAGAFALAACTPSGGAAGGSSGSGADAVPEYRNGFVGEQATSGEPVDGGTLTYADYAEARSLDPTQTLASGSSGGTALAAVYDVLVRYDQESDTYEPWLAESLQAGPDSRTWTLTLRPGVTFSDGTPLDAQAVVDSIGYYIDNRGYNADLLADSVERIQAQAADVVVFHLARPWPGFAGMLAQGPGMILAPAAYAGAQFQPIGAGPFTLQRYAPREELVLAAREDYWRGSPHLDAVRFVWFESSELKVDALTSGSVDAVFMREPRAVEQALDAGYPGTMTMVNLGHVVWVNNREGRPGADPRVRKAIGHAMDPAVTYQRAFDGAGLPSKNVFAERSRWFVPEVEPPPVDAERARALLEQAKADGYDGTLTLLSAGAATARDQSLTAKAMLERVGFTVELEIIQSVADQIARMYVRHDYDLARGALSVPDSAPFQLLYNGLYSESTTNTAGYRNPEMDRLLLQLQAAGSREAKHELVAQIEQLWKQTAPGVAMASRGVFIPWQDDVHGIVPTSARMLLFGDAWLG